VNEFPSIFFISINSELFLNILWKRVFAGTPVIACDTPFSFDSPNYSRNSFLALSQKTADFSGSQFLRKIAFFTKKGRLSRSPFGRVLWLATACSEVGLSRYRFTVQN